MTDIDSLIERLKIEIHLESAAIAPRTSGLIEAAREAADALAELRDAGKVWFDIAGGQKAEIAKLQDCLNTQVELSRIDAREAQAEIAKLQDAHGGSGMSDIDALTERLRALTLSSQDRAAPYVLGHSEVGEALNEAADALANQKMCIEQMKASSLELDRAEQEIAKLRDRAEKAEAEWKRIAQAINREDEEAKAEIAKLREALEKIVSLEWTAADGGEPAYYARAALGKSDFGNFVLRRSMGEGNDEKR